MELLCYSSPTHAIVCRELGGMGVSAASHVRMPDAKPEEPSPRLVFDPYLKPSSI